MVDFYDLAEKGIHNGLQRIKAVGSGFFCAVEHTFRLDRYLNRFPVTLVGHGYNRMRAFIKKTVKLCKLFLNPVFEGIAY